MKFSLKHVYKLVSIIIFTFILLTFIIALVKIPKYFSLTFSQDPFKVTSNVPFTEIKDQVIDYYKVLFSGSFGMSIKGAPVSDYIKTGFYKSATLLVGAIIISIVIGIIKGVFDSKKDKQIGSTVKLMTTIMGLSMPDVLVIILIQSFVVWLYQHDIKYFPVAGYETARHAILPMLSLSIIPTMYIARVTALSIDNIYSQEYIRTATGKGASKFRIVWIHVLRNAIVEISDSFSSLASMLVSSLLLVEYFYYYPGLSLVMFNNYTSGNTEVVIGIAIVLGLIYLAIDIVFKGVKYAINPRTRRG